MTSVYKDIEQAQKKLRRRKGESDKSFAVRLYQAQMDVYSAYAGSDLHASFDDLDQKTKNGWIKKAREMST